MEKYGFKRILSLLLALATVFVLCPVAPAVQATEPGEVIACPSCGMELSELVYEDWTGAAAITGDCHYRLTKKVVLSTPVEVAAGANLVLDLNGYSLYAAENSLVFNVSGGTVTVLDSSADGTGALVGNDVSGNGSAGSAYAGGTVSVTNKGTFNLLSGTVTGGTAAQGGNIYTAKGTFLNIRGGTVSKGTAVPVNGSTGRGGNIYTQATAVICGDAKIIDGTAKYDVVADYSPNNAGRGGNLFVHNSGTVTVSGNAVIANGHAGSRGGNITVNYNASLTLRENAVIYGGYAKSHGSNIDVMTATLTVEGGTIYGNPAGSCKNNISVYSTESVFNFTGGEIYGKINALPGMTINISGKPYIEQLYLPQTLDADGNETARALIVPGTFEAGAWVGLEVQAEDQRFTDYLTDYSSYMYFFNYTKQGLTWHGPRDAETQYLYLTNGTPCQCCGEDINDITWKTISISAGWQGVGTLTAGHYKLTGSVNLGNMMEPASIVIDASEGYVTLDLNNNTLTGPKGLRVFDFSGGGTFNVVDHSADKGGTIRSNGAMNEGGGVFALINTTGSELNVYAGNITGSVVGKGKYGGSIYMNNSNATLNLYGGSIVGGTSEDHGGNIFASGGSTVNIYGGSVADGTVTGGTHTDGTTIAGGGGNIYITNPTTVLNIYGGSVTGGTNEVSNGGNIRINSGGNFNMYGGIVENGSSTGAGGNIQIQHYSGTKYSQFHMYGGTVGAADGADSITANSVQNQVLIYNGTVQGTENVKYVASCSCYYTDTNNLYVWNYGHADNLCDSTCPMEAAWGKAHVESLVAGSHDYQAGKEAGTCECSICGYTFDAEGMVAVVDSTLYATLAKAIAATEAGGTLILLSDVTAGDVAISGITLDLNGCTLTADAFTSAASGNVIDSKNGKGAIISDSITVSDSNSYLPVTYDGGVRFCPVDFTQWLERVDENTTKVKFYFTQRSDETILDDIIKAGNTEIDVQINLTWTDSAGTAQDKTYTFGPELVQKYAQKWNGRVFVATITGGKNVTDLKCTYQVTSTATSGATVSSVTLNNVAYINQKLTWDQINSFPMKTKDMTVDEMRQAVLDFMYFTKTYVWTPDETVNFIKNGKGALDVMSQGQIYGGLPYVGLATGNVYRMMDYIDPETGLVDMEKALPALKDGGTLDIADLKYFGSQCSVAVYWGWGRVINSANYSWTGGGVPKNDFIVLGDVAIPEDLNSWSLTYNTVACCEENGQQTMFEAYALLQGADGLVQWTTAGHFAMAYSDAVVVRNSDGTIDGDNSYVMVIDQAATWKTLSNDAGDTFQHKNNVNVKFTFTKLFNSSYIPFTFKEFLGEASIQDTTVSLVNSGGTAYVDGTIRESDRAYITSQTTDTLAWSDLFSARVKSNYGIVDVYVTLYNAAGEQFYRHAVRTGTANNRSLAMAESGPQVTVWQYANVFENRTYAADVEVQLATGERVVIWSGNLTT